MSELPEFFEISGVANLDPQKALHAGVPESLIARDSLELIERDNDVIVELIGGNRPARSLIEHALRLGRNVVTANKAVLADHRAHLSEIAFVNGVKMRYSAAVGGAMPALEFVTDAAAAGKLRRIAGIVNGTCNFICGRLAEGGDLAEAVKEAQNAGFAEADPTLDLNGTDSAQKIVLLARAGFGIDLELARIDRRGIEQLDGTTIKAAAERGQAVRLVAEVQRAGDGLAASVRPVQVPFDHPFAKTSGAENCLLIEDDDGKTTLIRGKGAGRFPTTEAVLADLFDIYRDSQYSVPANAGMKAFAGAGQ
jgi:homoserine dehydrogenase